MGLRRLDALLFVALFIGAAGCDQEVLPKGDAAIDSGGHGGVPQVNIVPPEAPALPDFGICPEGWRSETTGDGFHICEPFPHGGRPVCARDEGFFPGAGACTLIGTACPAGDFPAGVSGEGSVVYVLAGAIDGDGSEAAPWGTINRAIAAATPGTVVAIGKGRYSEAVVIPEGVTLVGACVAETVLTSDRSSYAQGVLDIGGADVGIRNLRIADAARPGITVVGTGRSATIMDVVIHDCAVGAVSAEMGGTVTAERLVLRDLRSVEALSAFGRGINVETAGRATIRGLHVERAKEAAVVVMSRGELTLEDATLIETERPSPTAQAGPAIVATSEGRLVARRVIIEEATMLGIIMQNMGTEGTIEDLVVRRTRPGNEEGSGRGIDVVHDATLDCTRCLIEDVLEGGVLSNEHAALSLTDTLIRRVEPRTGDQSKGRAITVQNGGTAEVHRVAVTDLRDFGVLIVNDESGLSGNDLTIRRVSGDVSSGFYGRGLTVEVDATLDLARVEIGEVMENGLHVGEGSVAVLSDLYVHDVRPRALDGHFGRAVSVQLLSGLMGDPSVGNSSLILNRARIERAVEFGVNVYGAGTTFSGVDILVTNIASQGCPDSTCTEAPGGHCLGSYFGAEAAVERFDLTDAALCGVQIGTSATLQLQEGVVQGALIGACLQSDRQDIAHLQDNVRYLDNGSNLEATTLPVPAPLETSP